MRTDLKIGIAVGLLLILGVVVYFGVFSQGTKSEPTTQPGPSQDLTGDGGQTNILDTGRPPATPPAIADRGVPPATAPAPGSDTIVILPPAEGTTRPADRAEVATLEPIRRPAEPVRRPGEVIDPVLEPIDLADAGSAAPGGTTPSVDTVGWRTYVVQEGDLGFWGIAQKMYGDGKHYPFIAKANPDANSGSLRIGQPLRIPPLPKSTAPTGIDVGPGPAPTGGTPAAAPNTYTVQEGDQGFWGIAQKVYGDGNKWPILAKANPDVDSRALRIGQVLKVPPLSGAPAPAPAAPAGRGESRSTGAIPLGGQRTYIVQKGDSGYWGIAQKVYGNGKYFELIAKANPGVDPHNLQIGQEIVVPPLPSESATPTTGRAAPRSPASPAGSTRSPSATGSGDLILLPD
ncbi:MAG TPA: hypothetical protein DCX07_15560 [Phycisphaerales bacterium]|nr:hypothetical protein [Phycisphaerales bacterium]